MHGDVIRQWGHHAAQPLSEQAGGSTRHLLHCAPRAVLMTPRHTQAAAAALSRQHLAPATIIAARPMPQWIAFTAG
jgi:hypothetical protein